MAHFTTPESELAERGAYLFCRDRFYTLIRAPGGALRLGTWMEGCTEALRTPQYQPEMSAAERVYVDILVDKASNIHIVALSDQTYEIIMKCSRLPLSGVLIYELTRSCEYALKQIRRDQENLRKYLPQGDVGHLRFEVCHFLCKEEFSGIPHDYQAYLNPYLMDERACWVVVIRGHDFQHKLGDVGMQTTVI